jgi:hypothetical protein
LKNLNNYTKCVIDCFIAIAVIRALWNVLLVIQVFVVQLVTLVVWRQWLDCGLVRRIVPNGYLIRLLSG